MSDRYWVGGTGDWSDDTNHWATTSGGAPAGGNLPTSADSVFFDASSNATAYTVTVNATLDCLDFNLGAPATGKVTFAGSSASNIYGNFNLSGGSAGITWTYSSAATSMKATSAKTFDSNGVTLSTNNFIFNGASGKWTLQNNLDCGARDLTVTQGEFDTNAKTFTCGFFQTGGTSTRALTWTNSTVNIVAFTINNLTGFTGTFTGSTINISSGSGGGMANSSGSGITFNTVNITSLSGILAHAGANTYANLSFASSNSLASHSLNANITVDTLFTVSGSNTIRPHIASNTRGTARTITAASVSLADVLFEDITGAGAATWSGTRVGNCGGNSGITFDTGVNRYWVGNGGSATSTTNWATSSGGSSGASTPLPQDTAYVDAASFSSGSQTITLDQYRIGNWDFTGVDNSPALNVTASSFFYGDFIMDSGLGTVTTGAQTIRGRTQTVDLAGGGKSFDGNVVFDSLSTNVIQLSGAWSTTGIITHTSGSFNLNNFNCTSASFNLSNSNTRAITSGTGTLEVTSTGTVFTAATATGLTVNFTGGTIKISNASASTKTFSGGGKTWGALLWAVGTGTGNCDMVGSNTFASITDTGTVAHSMRFTAGTTTTITTNTFACSGSSGQLRTIGSITASGHTLSMTGSGKVSVDYMSISRSTVTQATTWYAGTHSTDGGNNSQWIFTDPPSSTSIKTVLGLAVASVKTVNGLAIASVKNFNGLA
jgi:hypothetical protein